MTLKHNFKKEGRTIWITGLSGSGKTSLAQELIKQMKSRIYNEFPYFYVLKRCSVFSWN